MTAPCLLGENAPPWLILSFGQSVAASSERYEIAKRPSKPCKSKEPAEGRIAPRDAATVAKVSSWVIYDHIKKGDIPAIKKGGLVTVLLLDVLAWKARPIRRRGCATYKTWPKSGAEGPFA
jgi:hypothetical protein